jgi:hypothetical protein
MNRQQRELYVNIGKSDPATDRAQPLKIEQLSPPTAVVGFGRISSDGRVLERAFDFGR